MSKQAATPMNHEQCPALAREVELIVSLSLEFGGERSPGATARLVKLLDWPCADVRVAAARALEWTRGSYPEPPIAESDAVVAALLHTSQQEEPWTVRAAISALRAYEDRPEVAVVLRVARTAPSPFLRAAAGDGLDTPKVVELCFAALCRSIVREPKMDPLEVASMVANSVWPRPGIGIRARFAGAIEADIAVASAWLDALSAPLTHMAGHLHFAWTTELRPGTHLAMQMWQEDALVEGSRELLALPSLDLIREAWQVLVGPTERAQEFWELATVAIILQRALKPSFAGPTGERTISIAPGVASPIHLGWLDRKALILWRDA